MAWIAETFNMVKIVSIVKNCQFSNSWWKKGGWMDGCAGGFNRLLSTIKNC
jgi:hypothetical protein